MKTYTIDGLDFNLKEDFTLNELDKIRELLSVSESVNPKTILLNTTNKEIKDFLSIVLIPLNSIKPNVDFGNIPESLAAEIVRDFFLQRI